MLNLPQQKEEKTVWCQNQFFSKFLKENLFAMEMVKREILMNNKPVYFGLSILEFSKILMYKFWYDHVKPKYGEKAKLCYMYTDSFIVYIKQLMFIKTLQKMLKLDLILQIMNQIDHCLKEKIKK